MAKKSDDKTFLENYYKGRYKPQGPQVVYIVPDNISKTKYIDIWRDAIPKYIESLGYTVQILEPKTYSRMLGAPGDLLFRSQQMEMLAHKLAINAINNGDIFIFLNIWNPLLIALEQYKRTGGRKSIVTLGIWRDDTVSAITEKMRYQRSDNPNIEYRRLEWAIHFSFGFFKACDFVLYDNKEQREAIWWAKSFKKSEWSKLRNYTGYPLSIAKRFIDYPIEKENVILIPYPVTTHNEKFYLDRLKIEFGKDYQIIELFDQTNCTREVYTYWLRKAKIVINFSKIQQHFKNLYEPFLYRTYIFTHDKIRPSNILPERYLFSRDLFSKTIPLMIFRNWVPLKERIQDVLENYDKYLPLIEEDEKMITEKYFPSDDFCRILEYLKHEK